MGAFNWKRIGSLVMVILFASQQSALAFQVEIQLDMNLRQAREGQIDMSSPLARLPKGTVLVIPDEYQAHNAKGQIDIRESIQNWVRSGADGAGFYNMSNGRKDFFLPTFTAEEVRLAKKENRAPQSKGLIALDYLGRRMPNGLVLKSSANVYREPTADPAARTSQNETTPRATSVSLTLEGQAPPTVCTTCEKPFVPEAQALSDIAAKLDFSEKGGLTRSESAKLTNSPLNPRTSRAEISQEFHAMKRGRPHKGVDIAAPYGTPIYATGSGIVSEVRPQKSRRGSVIGWGYYVKIDHGNGLSTLYAHLDPHGITVKPGEPVYAGQEIATVGKTGHTSGAHLHYEVARDGQQINPLLGSTNLDEIAMRGTSRIVAAHNTHDSDDED